MPVLNKRTFGPAAGAGLRRGALLAVIVLGMVHTLAAAVMTVRAPRTPVAVVAGSPVSVDDKFAIVRFACSFL